LYVRYLQLPIISGQYCVSSGYLCKSIGHVDLIVNLRQFETNTITSEIKYALKPAKLNLHAKLRRETKN